MKKIILLLITLLMLTCFASADYTLTKIINGVSVSTTVPEGRSVTLKYLKDTSIFTKWAVKNGNVTLSSDTATTVTFTMPASDVEIQAVLTTDHTHEYSEATCTTPATCSCGETSGSALGHSYTGTRTCDVNGSTDTVQCIRCDLTESQACTHTYTITADATTNGTVTLSATTVKAGGSATATITPSSGYKISAITVNGSSVTVSNTAGMTYTFINVTSNQTINVTFAIDNAAVSIGAYIKYVPTSTSAIVSTTDSGYSEEQTFNPSETTSWRVLYNNDGQLDIVSADGVYASNGDGLYLKGATGYAKAVDTLNNLCNEYVNTIYATSGRSIGCTSSSTGTITTPITWDYTYNQGNTGIPYNEDNYTVDRNQLANNGLTHGNNCTSCESWLASRFHWTTGDWAMFGLVHLTANGGVGYYYQEDGSTYVDRMVSASETYVFEYSKVYAIRPVVSLKSTISIVGGAGTVSNPYQIQ